MYPKILARTRARGDGLVYITSTMISTNSGSIWLFYCLDLLLGIFFVVFYLLDCNLSLSCSPTTSIHMNSNQYHQTIPWHLLYLVTVIFLPMLDLSSIRFFSKLSKTNDQISHETSNSLLVEAFQNKLWGHNWHQWAIYLWPPTYATIPHRCEPYYMIVFVSISDMFLTKTNPNKVPCSAHKFFVHVHQENDDQ